MSANPYWNPQGSRPRTPQGFGFQYAPQLRHAPRPPGRQGGSGVPLALGIVLGVIVLVPLLAMLAGALDPERRNTSEPVVTASHEASTRPGSTSSASVEPTTTSRRTQTPPITPPSSRQAPSPGPTSSPTPSPEPRPRRTGQVPDEKLDPLPTPDSDDPAWKTVQQAPIYNLGWPDLTGCPAASHADSMAEMRTQVDAGVECAQKAWRPVFERLGYSTHPVPVYYFEGATANSPCGSMQAPAMYCSADGGSMYFGTRLLQDSVASEIWIKLVIFHEYGHHIQNLSRVQAVWNQLPSGNETERRIEIQAECYATGMLRSDDSFQLTRANYEEVRKNMQSFIDDGIHGSPESLLYWGMRGFHSETIGGCNTWVVGSEKVR